MAKSKKPRKAYNPNKTLYARPPVFRYSKDEGENLKTRIYDHLSRFENHTAAAGDFIALSFRIRIGIGLCSLFEQEEARVIFIDALFLLELIQSRREHTGKWVMEEKEITKIKAALELVNQIQDKTTRMEQLPVFMKANKEIDHSLFERLP